MSKMPTDVLHSGGVHLPETLRTGWDALCRALGAGLRAVQRAQMMRALGGMSDSQLAGIGLRRSDIPHYAERLIAREGEGGSGRDLAD